MKKLLLFSLAGLLGSSSAFAQDPATIDLTKEDQFDYADNAHTPAETISITANFDRSFRYQDITGSLSAETETIPMKALIKLYNDFSAKYKPTHPHYTSALKIFIGMKDRKILFLFQPDLLECEDETTDADKERKYHIENKEKGYYQFDAKNIDFISIRADDAANYLLDYSKNVKSIRKFKKITSGKHFRRVRRPDSPKGDKAVYDTKYAIFPFSEIKDEYDDNHNDPEATPYSDNLILLNGSSPFTGDFRGERNKHHILIKCEHPTSVAPKTLSSVTGPFSNGVANLVALYPPNRIYVIYKLKTTL